MNHGNARPNNPEQSVARSLRLISTSEEQNLSSASGSQTSPSPSPALRQLQRELGAALAEARSLRELLEELPAILERKFQQRLQALLSEQRQLERENAHLQQHLLS
jgi:methylphosphotriester-DNA--protein-cysteine methyltransferase